MSNSRESSDPRYGPWKFVHELEHQDFKDHPVWLWCVELEIEGEEDGPAGGNETSMRPQLDSDIIPLDHLAPPMVYLKIKGTELNAVGLYDHEEERLDTIMVFLDNGDIVPVGDVPEVRQPAAYSVLARIKKSLCVEFKSDPEDANGALRVY